MPINRSLVTLSCSNTSAAAPKPFTNKRGFVLRASTLSANVGMSASGISMSASGISMSTSGISMSGSRSTARSPLDVAAPVSAAPEVTDSEASEGTDSEASEGTEVNSASIGGDSPLTGIGSARIQACHDASIFSSNS